MNIIFKIGLNSIIISIILLLIIILIFKKTNSGYINFGVRTFDKQTVGITIKYKTDKNIDISNYIKISSRNIIRQYYTLSDLKCKKYEIEAMIYEELFNELQSHDINIFISKLELGGIYNESHD